MARGKKMECRKLSLRGKILMPDNQRIQDVNLFDYVSPDRTIAWKVTGAWMWPHDVEGNTTGDHQFALTGALTTDTTGNWDGMDVEDNREFAWIYTGYYIRADNTLEFLSPIGTPITHQRFLVDEETVITNSLYFSGKTLSEAFQVIQREWNYLITLESMTITEQESILQQLKGIGQDIEN